MEKDYEKVSLLETETNTLDENKKNTNQDYIEIAKGCLAVAIMAFLNAVSKICKIFVIIIQDN